MNPTSMTWNGVNVFNGGERWSSDIRFRVAVMKEWSVSVLQQVRHG